MADHKRSLSTSTWPDLPSDIVSDISKCLDSAVDVSRLHSVCKNWRSSRNPDDNSILSPFLPRMIPNLSLPFTEDRPNAHVTLVARAVFLVKPLKSSSSCAGWLLTVEEPVPGKLQILYPLSKDRVKKLPSNFPKYLDLTKFKVSQVAKSYGFKFSSDGEHVPNVRRIVHCSESTVMVLYGEGSILRLRLKSGDWDYIHLRKGYSFLDVISYGENHRGLKMVKTILSKPVVDRLDKISLIQSNEDLFAAAYFKGNSSTDTKFVIYRLDAAQHKWIDVGNPFFCWKVLFISCDWSFFVYYHELNLRHYSTKPKRIEDEDYLSTQEMMRGDYVIFSENSFECSNYNTRRLYEGASLDLPIGVFFCNSDDVCFWNEPHCSRSTIDVLWPPPAWFLLHTSASIREDKDLNMHRHASSCSIKSPAYAVHASTKTATVKRQANFTAVRNSNSPTIQQLPKVEETRASFQGIIVQSNHLAILQEVWKKHGDIFQGSILRSYEAKAMALTCLAKILLILQTPGEGFTNDQVAYLESTLADLQFMRLKLDWLVPSVERLLAMDKQLEADLVALEGAKAKVEKTGERLLALKAEVKTRLDIDVRGSSGSHGCL